MGMYTSIFGEISLTPEAHKHLVDRDGVLHIERLSTMRGVAKHPAVQVFLNTYRHNCVIYGGGGNHHEQYDGIMEFDPDTTGLVLPYGRELKFYATLKNYEDVIGLFIAVLPLITVSYNVYMHYDDDELVKHFYGRKGKRGWEHHCSALRWQGYIDDTPNSLWYGEA